MKSLLMMMLAALLLLGPAACADKNETTEATATAQTEKSAEKADEVAVPVGGEENLAACRAATQKLGGAL